MDDQVPPPRSGDLRAQAPPRLGRRPRGDRLPEHLLLHPLLGEAEHRLERRPERHQEHVRPARHPRGRAEVPLRRQRPVRERGRLPLSARGPRQEGRHLLRHGHGPARARGDLQGALGHGDPARRQQARRAQLGGLVGRLVHLGAAGRRGGDPAPGLLPHQRGEHGPVRADPDHLRAGLVRALRRGLHRARLHQRFAALRGGGDHRQGGRALPLHHHPELVHQRLQPGDQAGGGPRERHHGVG